jgi:ribonuclease HI
MLVKVKDSVLLTFKVIVS